MARAYCAPPAHWRACRARRHAQCARHTPRTRARRCSGTGPCHPAPRARRRHRSRAACCRPPGSAGARSWDRAWAGAALRERSQRGAGERLERGACCTSGSAPPETSMPAPAHPSISFSLMKPFALSARRTPTPPRRMRFPLSVRLVAPDSSVSRPLMAMPSWQRGTPVLAPTHTLNPTPPPPTPPSQPHRPPALPAPPRCPPLPPTTPP